ncbi:MAG: hypothetical protein ACXQTL_08220, partial [Methanosarcinales archaeon]
MCCVDQMRRFIRILDDRIIKTSKFCGIGFIITIRRLLTQEMKHMRWGKKNSKIRETGSNITRRWSDVENSTS